MLKNTECAHCRYFNLISGLHERGECRKLPPTHDGFPTTNGWDACDSFKPIKSRWWLKLSFLNNETNKQH